MNDANRLANRRIAALHPADRAAEAAIAELCADAARVGRIRSRYVRRLRAAVDGLNAAGLDSTRAVAFLAAC